MGKRYGDAMQTISGRQYWPYDPRPEDINIDDVAHSIARQCRFAGHVKVQHYSVAEHSVLVSLCVPPEHALQALLHDATEAYLVDVPRPVKSGLAAYRALEHLNWLAVAKRFGVPALLHDSVIAADDAVLLAERDKLLRKTDFPWSVPGEPAKVRIWAHGPRVAQWRFLRRFRKLLRP